MTCDRPVGDVAQAASASVATQARTPRILGSAILKLPILNSTDKVTISTHKIHYPLPTLHFSLFIRRMQVEKKGMSYKLAPAALKRGYFLKV